jgi:hypothetical protein
MSIKGVGKAGQRLYSDRADLGGGANGNERWGSLVMKIEAGKHYELRNGYTAYIYEVDIGEEGIIAGKVTIPNCDAHVTTWTKNGRWSVDGDVSPNAWDIIKPVCENRKECWHNVYPDGFASDGYETKAEADALRMKGNGSGWIKVVWEYNKIVNVEWSNT